MRSSSDGARASALALVLSSACFTGSDAAGLPCEKDDDCGLKYKCENHVCGGPPGDMDTSSGTIDPTTSTDGSSGPDPDCGNGVVEDDEDCEPAEPGFNGPDCDRDCTVPLCGDGIENPLATDVEECDASVSSGAIDGPDCDIDCTAVVCGDNHTNPFTERCDDANADDFDGCTAQCFVPFLSDPMTEATADWTVETPMYVADVPPKGSGVMIEYQLPPESSDTFPETSEPTGWRHQSDRWESGALPYSGIPDGFHGLPGTTRLVSREIELSLDLDGDGDTEDDAPLLEGVRYELRFHHEYAFDGCGAAPTDGDGGIIRIYDVAADTYDAVAPTAGYTATIRGGDTCFDLDRAPNPIVLDAPPTPYGAVACFTGSTSVDEDVVVDLDAYRGRTIRVVFEQGFDCLSCVDRTDDAWKIDHVIVAPYAN